MPHMFMKQNEVAVHQQNVFVMLVNHYSECVVLSNNIRSQQLNSC